MKKCKKPATVHRTHESDHRFLKDRLYLQEEFPQDLFTPKYSKDSYNIPGYVHTHESDLNRHAVQCQTWNSYDANCTLCEELRSGKLIEIIPHNNQRSTNDEIPKVSYEQSLQYLQQRTEILIIHRH